MAKVFQGDEFEWLRAQVDGALWWPDVPSRSARPPTRGPVGPLPSASEHASDPTKRAMTVQEYNAWRAGAAPQTRTLPYVHQQFPMVLYKKGEKPRTIPNAREYEQFMKGGWEEVP